jgi:hypothetical protein
VLRRSSIGGPAVLTVRYTRILPGGRLIRLPNCCVMSIMLKLPVVDNIDADSVCCICMPSLRAPHACCCPNDGAPRIGIVSSSPPAPRVWTLG